MQVIHYSDLDGKQFKEIISRQYRRLQELKNEYEKRGAKTWINLFDCCEGSWMLTVMER